MKPGKPLTTRRLIRWVFVASLFLGLYWPFIDMSRNPKSHMHTYVLKTEDGRYRMIPQQTREPLSSAYWRRLTGNKLPEKRHCGASWGQSEEVCALEHPEITVVNPLWGFQALPHQIDYADRMNAELDRKKAADDLVK